MIEQGSFENGEEPRDPKWESTPLPNKLGLVVGDIGRATITKASDLIGNVLDLWVQEPINSRTVEDKVL